MHEIVTLVAQPTAQPATLFELLRARLEGVVLDQTVTTAKRLILREGLGARLKARAGNMFTVDLGTGYDAVLVSNVIHVFNEEGFDSLDPDDRGGRPRKTTPSE